MRISKFLGVLRGQALSVLCLTLAFLVTPSLPSAEPLATETATTTNAPAQSEVVPEPSAVPAARLSAGLQEIVKMGDAKIDLAVIRAYIKNSPMPYNLSAADIVALKQHGIPDDIVTALLEHGGELKTQAAAAGAPMSNSVPAPYYYYRGINSYPYDYSASPSDYQDYGSPYYSYYPYNYWWYGYSSPWWWYYPFFSVDRFGHRHFHDFRHDGHFNQFHGGQGFRGAGARSPFGTFNPKAGGFSGTRAMSPGTFAPHRFAASPRAFSPAGGFPMGRSGSFAARAGGFRSGGGFAGRGGGGRR